MTCMNAFQCQPKQVADSTTAVGCNATIEGQRYVVEWLHKKMIQLRAMFEQAESDHATAVKILAELEDEQKEIQRR